MTDLPSKDSADHAVDNGTDDALDRFISRWEPPGVIQKREWRRDLLEVLESFESPLSRNPCSA